ncbi:MAG: pyrimidine-nucleoside phosphorylase [Armatimonadota bacterium]|nr:pyrimidine-nucleoside phosphorylase [Armatimonadota bacterium]MDR7440161.1 pyrimidine-nucleoside phosphorylase [Armatimonadota bacterium]MDR7562615.1 pyrimidine-nucleoside phosphorylase [Armatimonadota bacterium]MDR7602910.1 pyrimidine-nucleoside phosphorylase [Armatimonadota bacterium]
MRVEELIRKKRDGGILSREELAFLVEGFVRGEVADYQMSAWLMSVYFRGMTDRETADLTLVMARSGRMLDLSGVPGPKVDKHSSGGVGDKTSLVVVPLVASCGVKVPKMSGRGLGHTGGTLDKLESIPGLRTEIPVDRFIEQVRRVGCAIVAQSEELAPADRKLYALRDVTATVDSLPLIASSIMSKKLATGADAIVLDVKTGSGAFMKRVKDALSLARSMVEIGRALGRRTVAVVSDMDQPLGHAVGNSVEVEEALGALRGEGPEDLVELCMALGVQMLLLAGRVRTEEEGQELLRTQIRNGAGLRKLAEMVEAQGGDPAVVDDPRRLPRAPRIMEVPAPESGYVQAMDAEAIGRAAVVLGAGRARKEDRIDHGVGIWVEAKVGSSVEGGQPLARLLCRDEETGAEAARRVRTAYRIGPEAPRGRPLIHTLVV